MPTATLSTPDNAATTRLREQIAEHHTTADRVLYAIESAAINASENTGAADYHLHRISVLASVVGVDADEQMQRRARAAADLAHAAMRNARRAGRLAKAAAEAADFAHRQAQEALATLDGKLNPDDADADDADADDADGADE